MSQAATPLRSSPRRRRSTAAASFYFFYVARLISLVLSRHKFKFFMKINMIYEYIVNVLLCRVCHHFGEHRF
jgi:hypothetical protein